MKREQIEDIILKVADGDMLALDALIDLNEIKYQLEESLKLIKEFQQEFEDSISSEVDANNGIYKGYEIKLVSGRKSYSYKGISEIEEVLSKKKELESKYKSLFEVYQKTGQQPMSEDGEVYDLPEISYGKSYFRISKSKY